MKKKRTTKIIVHKQYPIIKLKVHDLEEDYDRISRVLCVTMFFLGGGILSTYVCPRPRTEDNRTGGRKNADNPEGLPQKTRKRIANPQIDKKKLTGAEKNPKISLPTPGSKNKFGKKELPASRNGRRKSEKDCLPRGPSRGQSTRAVGENEEILKRTEK